MLLVLELLLGIDPAAEADVAALAALGHRERFVHARCRGGREQAAHAKARPERAQHERAGDERADARRDQEQGSHPPMIATPRPQPSRPTTRLTRRTGWGRDVDNRGRWPELGGQPPLTGPNPGA